MVQKKHYICAIILIFLTMALIKLTAIVDNISGKLNGTVFARNKGGHYMRSKSNPINPRTVAQQAVRASFGAIAQLWRGLTNAQRDAWAAAASDFPYQNKLGDTKILSGFALHQKLNRNLELINNRPITDPPAPAVVPAPVSFSVQPVLDDSLRTEISFSAEVAEGASAIISATPPLSPGVKNFQNRLRKIDVVATIDFNAPVPLLASYEAIFGSPAKGTKIGFRVYVINDATGQESAPLDTEIIVV